jgi:hypothetical protein
LPLTVPDGGVVLSRPRPTLGCSAHDDDDKIPGKPHTHTHTHTQCTRIMQQNCVKTSTVYENLMFL